MNTIADLSAQAISDATPREQLERTRAESMPAERAEIDHEKGRELLEKVADIAERSLDGQIMTGYDAVVSKLASAYLAAYDDPWTANRAHVRFFMLGSSPETARFGLPLAELDDVARDPLEALSRAETCACGREAADATERGDAAALQVALSHLDWFELNVPDELSGETRSEIAAIRQRFGPIPDLVQ